VSWQNYSLLSLVFFFFGVQWKLTSPFFTPNTLHFFFLFPFLIEVDVRFVIHFRTVYGQVIGILGSHPSLGAWDKNKPALMTYTSDGNWEKSIEVPQNFGTIEYKYVLIDTQSNLPVRWEAEKNKSLSQLPAQYSKIEVRDFWQVRIRLDLIIGT